MEEKHNSTWMTIARIAALVFVIAITVALYIYRNQVQRLQVLGFPGIFLVSVLAISGTQRGVS